MQLISWHFFWHKLWWTIFPLAFLTKMKRVLAEGSQGVAAMQQAEKSYLLALHHAEVVKHKWGGSTYTTVVEVQAKIVALLKEYVESGDKAEACHCIQELNLPFSIMRWSRRQWCCLWRRKRQKQRSGPYFRRLQTRVSSHPVEWLKASQGCQIPFMTLH